MTYDEHAARAMLMGRMYDWRDGTYCKVNDMFGTPSSDDMIDCVTLRGVSTKHSTKRNLVFNVGNHLNDFTKEARLRFEPKVPWETDT